MAFPLGVFISTIIFSPDMERLFTTPSSIWSTEKLGLGLGNAGYLHPPPVTPLYSINGWVSEWVSRVEWESGWQREHSANIYGRNELWNWAWDRSYITTNILIWHRLSITPWLQLWSHPIQPNHFFVYRRASQTCTDHPLPSIQIKVKERGRGP